MRIVNKEYKVYKFEELKPDVQESVMQSYYENEDYPFLYDDIINELHIIDDYFDDRKLFYSLSYCQGDGLSFSGTFMLNEWLEYKYPNMKTSVFDVLCNYLRIWSTGNTGNYCYASKSDIKTEDYDFAHCRRIEKFINDELLPGIQEYYLDICKELEKYGYNVLEYRMDKEEFAEHAESNEWEYLADGTPFYMIRDDTK